MRCFIAIDIDETIRKGLRNLQDELRKKVDIGKGDVKWVRPEITHLTLKFLGEIKDEQVVEVCNITKDVASRHKRFGLDV
ncbi:MAG: RNA 2',3'-cyclic phosphodiesterase, partial [Planctomycetota bacterium]